ncbi:MAG TPA: HEPN domain-containing protein [Terriglobia bacterium]|nr:HEPN domain-containing protein [Terriglobia bacterium]
MTPESEALLRKSRRSLEAGQLLLSEGFMEDAASEAYYAMFYAAKAILVNAGQKATQHKHVVRKFQQLFVVTGRIQNKYYDALEEALKLRHFADYETDLSYPVPSEEASTSLGKATEFVVMAEEFLRGAEP